MNKTLAQIVSAFIPFSATRKRIRKSWIYNAAGVTPDDQMPFIGWATERPERPSPPLNSFAGNVFSQCGEDGIIEQIFSRIGVREKFGIEFGAWDGKHLSNIFNLVQNHAWNALMIEGNTNKFPALEETAREVNGRICAVCGMVGIKKYPLLDTYVGKCPKEPDILSIDVDGVDYYIWESLETIHPRVVIIEHNATVPIDVIFIQAKNESVFECASASALVELGARKGYSPVAVTPSNLIFVNNEDFPKLDIKDNSLDALWPDSPRSCIFNTPTGKIYSFGMEKLNWRNVEIRSDTLQYFSSFRWKDGDAIK